MNDKEADRNNKGCQALLQVAALHSAMAVDMQQGMMALPQSHCLWVVGFGMTGYRAEAHQPYLHPAYQVWSSQSPGRHETDIRTLTGASQHLGMTLHSGLWDDRPSAEAHQPYHHLAHQVWPSQSPGRHETDIGTSTGASQHLGMTLHGGLWDDRPEG